MIRTWGAAVAKAQLGAGQNLPVKGNVFISVQDSDKMAALPVARDFYNMGFKLLATRGTAMFLEDNSIPAKVVEKVSTGRPHVVDAVKNSEIQLILNTGSNSQTKRDGYEIRRAAIRFKIPYATTTDGAKTICEAIKALKKEPLTVIAIQDYHRQGGNI